MTQHEFILQALAIEPRTAKQLAQMMGRSNGTVQGRLLELSERGDIKRARGPDGGWIYSLVSSDVVTKAAPEEIVLGGHRETPDSSCPRFAYHERHVEAVQALGGFVRFSERRLPGGGIAPCLPLLPAQVAA